jgi:endogenous inhibitor of DNA gyrase (YacG/DUF329 family)
LIDLGQWAEGKYAVPGDHEDDKGHENDADPTDDDGSDAL